MNTPTSTLRTELAAEREKSERYRLASLKLDAELAVSESERMEQARLLGKSGSREAALLAELANEREKVKVLLTALENYKNRVIAGGTNPARSAIAAAMKEQSNENQNT